MLPTLTVADPPGAGEGSLDPLGRASLGDRLAELLVPDVRARMGRVRYLTVMAVASIVTNEVGELLILDGRATPSLAFKWLLFEGYVRRSVPLPRPWHLQGEAGARPQRSPRRELLPEGTGGVGFNGIYKPLATGLNLVTSHLLLAERARELALAWERENDLPGDVDGVDSLSFDLAVVHPEAPVTADG